ncbi:MAG TPA: aromatic ring-hydroxylating dioxygenase subunit alpha [Burkholderiales bacterium]
MAIERIDALKGPFQGYYHRAAPREDEELTHVGPGTPCGEYLRRFWHPIIFSDDLKDLPRRIRVMGEDLVVFRDRSGRVGCLELHCSHRGTSLEFGVVSERGIRCCYHGWLFDVDGRILEAPAEGEKSTYKDRLFHGAYPTVERNGLVFVYMGPPDRKPPFRELDTFSLPGYRCLPGRRHHTPCNWLQIKENCMDPVHLAFLHTIISGAQFTPAFGILPPTEFVHTSCGLAYVSPRRVGENIWVRISDFIPPNIHQFGSVEDGKKEKLMLRAHMTIWAVPVDDTNTINTGFIHIPNDMEIDEQQLRALKESVGQTGDRPYEDRQRRPGDYDAQTGQGPIAVHAREHLAPSDRGVVMLRRMIREGIRAVAAGEDPYGARPESMPVRTYAQDTVLRIPPAADPEAEHRLLVETGRKVLEGHYLQNPPAWVTPKMLRDAGF